MSVKLKLFLLFIAMLLSILACSSETSDATIAPAKELGYGVINCPECDGIALILWGKIGDIGGSGGKVHHGDRCKILDSGSYEGIAKYKLNCNGKIGWLRAEGVLRE